MKTSTSVCVFRKRFDSESTHLQKANQSTAKLPRGLTKVGAERLQKHLR